MSKLLKKTDGKLTRDQQARRYALVMLLPALIFLACLIAYPLGKVLHDAFSHVHLINKSMTGFAGLDNFKKVVSDEHFAQAIRRRRPARSGRRGRRCGSLPGRWRRRPAR